MTELYQYRACGLDYVYLRNGYVRRHGGPISIRNEGALHETIARAIITSSYPLRGKEVRFLRSLLKLSQAGLARVLQTTRVTVARWEGSANQPMPGTADTALRLFYAGKTGKRELCAQVCNILGGMRDGLVEQRITLRETTRGWEREPERQAA